MSLIIAIILIVIGFILMLMEIFLIPGITIFGIFGLLSIVGGIIYSYMINPAFALYTFLGSAFISGVLVTWVTKSKAWDKLIQHTSENLLEGFRSSKEDLEFLTGKTGHTITRLRPSGTAIINDQRIDVVSEGVFIDKDISVEVIRVEGNKVVVRPIQEDE